MDACYCDYDPAIVYNQTRPIARKQHECSECDRTIQAGERYERVKALWDDGNWQVYKTCVYCLAIRDYVELRTPCLCWAHGNMLEDVRQTVEDIGCEVPGLIVGVGRLVIEAKREKHVCNRR